MIVELRHHVEHRRRRRILYNVDILDAPHLEVVNAVGDVGAVTRIPSCGETELPVERRPEPDDAGAGVVGPDPPVGLAFERHAWYRNLPRDVVEEEGPRAVTSDKAGEIRLPGPTPRPQPLPVDSANCVHKPRLLVLLGLVRVLDRVLHDARIRIQVTRGRHDEPVQSSVARRVIIPAKDARGHQQQIGRQRPYQREARLRFR
mmetsp:Transcript_27616/g.77198  ORF Transcript_27616/g.77198 Transcript_27616/m.77198 type:complete len:203 (-) Transcript_27616:970-1578(-)